MQFSSPANGSDLFILMTSVLKGDSWGGVGMWGVGVALTWCIFRNKNLCFVTLLFSSASENDYINKFIL